ncbi:fructose-like specific PTS system EIIC component 2 [Escherichia coli]|uniref:Fructose-like specific PTS system EIIC component 2 n=1 Tax=Escherichia coli TaxID=562 RepID=A0A485JQ71_ECOLX|nr:fructose-like specific PTS system EIIC component 2 [Escherichia coli]
MNELVQILKNTRQHLMTGVSHMIPFVVSGGICWRFPSCCMAKVQCRMP